MVAENNEVPSPERREYPKMVSLVACIDEDIDYGENVVAFGMAGTGITKLGEGNQKVYPDEKREVVEKVRPFAFSALNEIAVGMGMPLLATSHVGCGAAAAQEVPADQIAAVTKKMCTDLEIDYLGHIPHADEPVEVGNSNVEAHIGRSEEEHHHGARRIVITVGGGITEEELQALESDGYGDAFIVSADWLSRVVESGSVSREDALTFVGLQVDIADGIADGVSHFESVRVWNAGRMESQQMLENIQLVNELIKNTRSA